MKINRYGKVIITENDIVVSGFEVNGGVVGGFSRWALRWAIQRIDEKRTEIGDFQNKSHDYFLLIIAVVLAILLAVFIYVSLAQPI